MYTDLILRPEDMSMQHHYYKPWKKVYILEQETSPLALILLKPSKLGLNQPTIVVRSSSRLVNGYSEF